jgi:small subunit ribosomal protein S16
LLSLDFASFSIYFRGPSFTQNARRGKKESQFEDVIRTGAKGPARDLTKPRLRHNRWRAAATGACKDFGPRQSSGVRDTVARKPRIVKPSLPSLSRAAGLPFPLTSGIIRLSLDLAGLFRNKDIRLVLMIRLARRGARKQPHYRIVVIEKERARNGRPVEVVGTYNPRTNPASIELKRDRVEYWVSKGAQMSDRVNKLFLKPAPAPASAGSAA